ncbi:helix-turn-helix transcriptional regulator [Tumebacillus avium]|uniref:helix-turn-helix transcriptional regulator n=1 Tax=Tumebacillus avium TaxID=1903704 RepID=UPI0018DF662B|nr:helix-turn-helix transcriptional regulator [Tumebacillus avium]
MRNDNRPKMLGAKIQELRITKGLTQGELGQGLVTPSMISQIESGRANPSYKLLCQLAERLEVPLAHLTAEYHETMSIGVQLKTLQACKEKKEFSDALMICENLLQNELPNNVLKEVLFVKAECLVWTRKPDEAIECFRDLLKRLNEWGDQENSTLASIYNLLGCAYFNKLDLLTAHSYFVQADSHIQKIDNLDIAQGYIQYNLGRVHEWMDDTEAARVHYEQALAVFNEVSNSHRELANLYYAIGINRTKDNDLASADKYLNDAIALYKASNMIDMIQKVKETQAFHCVSKHDPGEAKLIMLNCCNYFKEAGDYQYVAYTYAKLAMLALSEGNLDEAQDFLGTMERENDRNQVLPVTNHFWAYIYRVYAQYHFHKLNYGEAVKYANRSAEIFDIIGLKREAAKSLQITVDSETEEGNLPAALATSKKAIEILSKEGGK